MSEDVKFSCTACHIHDEKEVMTSCNLCGRLHCTRCVDEHGRCVDCQDEERTSDD